MHDIFTINNVKIRFEITFNHKYNFVFEVKIIKIADVIDGTKIINKFAK